MGQLMSLTFKCMIFLLKKIKKPQFVFFIFFMWKYLIKVFKINKKLKNKYRSNLKLLEWFQIIRVGRH